MKNFYKKPVSMLTMICMMAVLISSCKKDEAVQPIVYGDAKFTVTNTVATSKPQNFFQNTTKLTTTAVSYGQTSSVFTLKAGNSSLFFKDEVTDVVTATLLVGLETDVSYTTFYYTNPLGKGLITGFANDQIAPTIGKVKVRFVNVGGLLANPIRMGVSGGNSLNSELGLGNSTGYFTIDAGSTLEVAVLNTAKVTTIPSSSFVSGKIYTVWVNGSDFTADVHIIQQN